MPRFLRVQCATPIRKRPDLRLLNLDHVTDVVLRYGSEYAGGGRQLCERCWLTIYLTSIQPTSIGDCATAEAREIVLYDSDAEQALELLEQSASEVIDVVSQPADYKPAPSF